MRKYTNKILELVNMGYYGDTTEDTERLIVGLLSWMSEDDVKKFWFANGYDWIDDLEENADAN